MICPLGDALTFKGVPVGSITRHLGSSARAEKARMPPAVASIANRKICNMIKRARRTDLQVGSSSLPMNSNIIADGFQSARLARLLGRSDQIEPNPPILPARTVAGCFPEPPQHPQASPGGFKLTYIVSISLESR
jgi:hypothetical protein